MNIHNNLEYKGAYPRVKNLKGSGLTLKHETRQERLARHKHSSVLRTLSISYSVRKSILEWST
jgi:hypothetical protein